MLSHANRAKLLQMVTKNTSVRTSSLSGPRGCQRKTPHLPWQLALLVLNLSRSVVSNLSLEIGAGLVNVRVHKLLDHVGKRWRLLANVG